MKKYILLFFFFGIIVYAYSQDNEQILRTDFNSCLQLIDQNLPNDYQRIANTSNQYIKEYAFFNSIAIVRDNRIIQITLRFTNNIKYIPEIYPRFMTIFRIVSNLGTYIGVYDRFFGFRLSNNRYALIENIPVNRNESHQYEPIVNLTSKINENLFTTYSRVNNFDINIINYILNLFGKNVPSDFSSITTLM